MLFYLRGMKRQGGQILPIAAAAFLVMCALAGLAVDSSRDYLVKRQAQNAADFAVLAASKQMAQQLSLQNPLTTGSRPVIAAHDYAANNGFPTIYSAACDAATGTSFTTSWFDVAGLPCTATAGFTNKVSLNSPAQAFPGSPVPSTCTGTSQFACVQVVITTKIGQLFTTILGIPNAYVTVGATAKAVLPGSAFSAPPPIAVSLYEPQAGCLPLTQTCFNELLPAARSQLSCASVGSNCPTFWATPGTAPKIYGYDGSVLNVPANYTALQSNGDMVIQDATTICDPYGGATCSPNAAIGAAGWAIPANTKDYCSANSGVASTPCTTVGQAPLSTLYGNQAAFVAPAAWSPTVSTAGLTNCGSLVLDGQAVYGACANAADPYEIGHGIYSSIVINHGTYEFGSGLYDITDTARVNDQTAAGYIANGIDHSQETASDFDLCTGALPNSCPTLTAGIWIGHGGGSFYAFTGPTPGSCTSGVAGAGGGGGDATIISGSGVVFRFEPRSAGFVSTHEVKSMTLAGAGVGAVSAVAGAPLLFDMENNGWIHIDTSQGQQGGNGIPPNTTSGIIYQTISATGGGVEFDPSMAGFDTLGNELPAVQGQILAYSLTIFGRSGGTLDFTNGYGGGSVPGIGTSGRDEVQIIGTVTLRPGAPGYSVLTANYTDEYMMDAYDVYVKVNNGNPQFFSQGMWSPAPGPGSPLPPPGNNPGDANPTYPPAAAAPAYTIVSQSGLNYDYRYAIPGASGATIELKGNWVWGHQNDSRIVGNANGTNNGSYTAQLIYTFPNPAGNYLSVTIFFLDGDRCGDYAYVTYTFQSTGGPGPGQQSQGSVSLVQ